MWIAYCIPGGNYSLNKIHLLEKIHLTRCSKIPYTKEIKEAPQAGASSRVKGNNQIGRFQRKTQPATIFQRDNIIGIWHDTHQIVKIKIK